MIFVEWWHVERLCLLLLIVAIASLFIWSLRKKHWLVRLPIQLLLGLLLCALLFLVTLVSTLPGNSYSAPVYSPNGKMAARIVEYNASGLGGADDTVKLFTAHGFSSDVVFFGEFNSVKAKNIQWKSDSELEISYEGTPYQCTSTRRVKVRCWSTQQDSRMVIVRVYRDREADFAHELDRELYSFANAHQTTGSGKWIWVATVEPFHYAEELGGKVAMIKPQLIVLDRASDVSLIRGMDVNPTQAINACGPNRLCPAFIPSWVSGEELEAAKQVLAAIATSSR